MLIACLSVEPGFRAELTPLDMSLLCALSEVVLPQPDKGAPPFIPADWVNGPLADVVAQLQQQDDEQRKPPMAFVCCSRGGKTRSLKELGRAVHAHRADVTILYVTFNDFSSLQPWEQSNPVEALLRRIAFASLRGRDYSRSREQYAPFRTAHVAEDQMLAWLGQAPCLLLIDELNLVTELSNKGSAIGRNISEFLKEDFLGPCNRQACHFDHAAALHFHGVSQQSRGVNPGAATHFQSCHRPVAAWLLIASSTSLLCQDARHDRHSIHAWRPSGKAAGGDSGVP
jgi:hypothetical protein